MDNEDCTPEECKAPKGDRVWLLRAKQQGIRRNRRLASDAEHGRYACKACHETFEERQAAMRDAGSQKAAGRLSGDKADPYRYKEKDNGYRMGRGPSRRG